MTLNNFIEKYKEEYGTFSIGADSAFFFIGTYPDYITYINAVSQKAIDNVKKLRKQRIKTLDWRIRTGPPDRDKYANEADYEYNLRKYHTTIQNFPGHIKANDEYLRTFVPFEDRDVLTSCGSLLIENHCIVKVEGTERGKYWFREEFLKDYKAVYE